MPGSSVSACHMCHLHSHNQDNLLKTSPLRNSRGRNRSSSKHRNHHGHSNSGFSSTRDEDARVIRSNSSSALARLTDNSHSLPGSRSNSLSRYHREVSIMPDGGDTYGRGMRSCSSTRSLDTNPPMTTILDARTTSLPRIASLLHSHPQIHPQPDIIVNALPRSRGDSRTGSLSRAAVNLSQDNSHDYYLDIHRQRFKDEKRKHRFNLQTVMLIGCYTLLVMIAIVVGVVLCYQNGWFGLGPPQEKISREIVRFNNSHSSQGSAVDFRNRRKNERTNERVDLDSQSARPSQRNRNNVDDSSTTDHGHRPTSLDINKGNAIRQRIPQQAQDQFSQRNIRPQVNVGNAADNMQLRNNHQNIHQNNFPTQPTGAPLNPTNVNAHLANENQRFLRPIHTLSRQPEITLQGQDSFVRNKQSFDNNHDASSFATGVPVDINTKNKFIIRRPSGEIFSNQQLSDKQIVRTGNVDSNTIAKNLHQAGFPVTNQAIVQTRDGVPSTKTESNQQNIPGQNSNVNSSPHDLLSIPVHDKVLPSDSDSFTTQQLLDLLAIRRMRDLLNSEVNAQSILDILRNVEPSQDTRLEQIRKESLNPIDDQNRDNLRLLRAQGRSIQEPLSDISNNNQIRSLLAALGGTENSDKKAENFQDERNIEGSATEILPTNLSIDTISANIDTLINSTVNGAIIRLLNRKSSVTPETPDVDISGVSVFPLNSKDLRILLESNPSNIEENIGPLNNEKLRSLQILHRLIELNNLKQKVQRHVDDALSNHNIERGVLNSKIRPISRRQPLASVSEERVSPSSVINSRKTNVDTSDSPIVTKVPLHNVTASFNRGSTLNINEEKSSPTGPDPSFAVLVRTDGLSRPIQNKRTVSRSPHLRRNPITSERQRKIERQAPIKEQVAVQPGRGRGRTNSAIIRAWTHMDKEGTLSKGRIHSDGSFTFTNCRPVEVCRNKNENQSVPTNRDSSSTNKK